MRFKLERNCSVAYKKVVISAFPITKHMKLYSNHATKVFPLKSSVDIDVKHEF